MNKKIISLILGAAWLLSACNPQNDADTRANPSASQAFVTQATAPKSDGTVSMLLPDFAQLVAREGGSVVNIRAVSEHRERVLSEDDNVPLDSADDLFSEFLKRLIPNQPDWEQGSDNEVNFGSGFIISEDGFVLTNAHVIKGMNRIKVTLNDKREYPAKLIGLDEKSDVALLKIEAKNLPVAKIGNPSELKSGEWVAAIGAPFGFENSVTAGIVSAKNRTLPDETYTPFIQTDVAINPGNSGGPLFNLKGQVVGINSQIYSRSGGFMGISFAIPIDVAMNVAEQLKATGKVQRAQLGAMIQEVSYDLAKSFGLDKPTGALVVKVFSGSPAQKGGLQVGDIIRTVDGEEVRSSIDLPMMISTLTPGKEVKLGVWRKGKMVNMMITLGQQSDSLTSAQNNESSQHSGNTYFDVPEVGLTLRVVSQAQKNMLVVSRVQGIAAHAGLRRNDVIREVGGQAVHSQVDFETALAQAGNNVPLLVQRGNNMVFLALILS